MDGTFATVIIQEDTIAAAARNMITEDDFAAETRHSISMLIFNSLYTNSPITNAYTAYGFVPVSCDGSDELFPRINQ